MQIACAYGWKGQIMSNPTISSPFATAKADATAVAALIALAVPLMSGAGTIPWARVEAATGIGYSRGWLIVRRAYLELNAPELLVDVASMYEAARQRAIEAHTLSEFAPDRTILSPIVSELRDLRCSWGEIAVRVGLPESKVRSAFRLTGGKKDLGLRIGLGGRFAYDAPELYRANRKAEGAHIDAQMARKPKEQELLNYVPEEAPATKPERKAKSA